MSVVECYDSLRNVIILPLENEKLGFIKKGDIFEEAGIMHYKMVLSH